MYESVLAGYASAADADKFESIFVSTRERFVVECMKEAGFTYLPIDPLREGAIPKTPDVASRDFVERSGFGILSAVPASSLLSPDEVSAFDPNADAYSKMSPAEQVNFSNALDGGGDQDGCIVEAAEKARKELGLVTLDSSIDERLARVLADSRYVASQAAWAECVAKQGYPYATTDDMYAEFTDILATLERAPDGSLTAESTARLATGQSREIKVATDLFECNETLRVTFQEVFDSTKPE